MATPLIQDERPRRSRQLVSAAQRHTAELMFVAGFLFDVVTLQRIDAWTDLGVQLLYLCGLAALLFLQQREAQGRWTPPALLARWWPYNVDLLHFLYGGLLSAYVVLYFRSSTGASPLVFFLLLVGLLLVNELPQIRRVGHHWRLGLFAFCVVSFLNYFVPILLGRMGTWVFCLGLLAAAAILWLMAGRLARFEPQPRRAQQRLFAPAAAVSAAILVLYLLRLIPPVPLSVQFHGVYHDVRRENGAYVLTYEEPSRLIFWRHDSRPFHKRAGDRLHYFLRVFAPTGFAHRVVVRWETQDGSGSWQTTDRIPIQVAGGRARGFRGFATKARFDPGPWRVTAETEDGRALATLSFTVEADDGERPRTLLTRVE